MVSYRPIPVKPIFAPKRERMIFGAIPAPATLFSSTKTHQTPPKATAKIEKKRGILSRLFGRAK